MNHPWLDLLGASANVSILLALGAALASPRRSHVARPLVATLALACAWLLTAVLYALRADRWTVILGGGVIVASVVAALVTVHLWTQAGAGSESDPRQRGDGGGPGPRRGRPEAPKPGGDGGEPGWWPEFERQLASYAAERGRATGERAVRRAPSTPAPPRGGTGATVRALSGSDSGTAG